jgi:Tfp pilus assembly protein PilE
MRIKTKIFSELNAQRGTVLIEFLLTIALAATLMPFIYSFQMRAVTRAENVRVSREMQRIQSVFEHYIVQNKDSFLGSVGRSIIRVNLSDLQDYGLDENFVSAAADKYQLRVLKSKDAMGQATLQGAIVLNNPEITPLRTREIVSLGDDKIGFIDGTRAYGGFGTWRANTADFGIDASSGIIQMTAINRDNSLYLWRLPSNNQSDATMMSALNLGARDIKNASFINAGGFSLQETYEAQKLVVNDLIFNNRTTIDSEYKTQSALVSGALSGDSKNISVSGTFNLADLAKVSSFTADNLWTNTLTLSGLSTPSGEITTLRAAGALDMTEGRVNALYVTVGFTGSITSRLGVRDKIVDSVDPNFYWDAKSKVANLVDINSPTLSDLAVKVLRRESVSGTIATRVFSAAAANKNATMGDFLNAINEIGTNVRAKYRMLNLQ